MGHPSDILRRPGVGDTAPPTRTAVPMSPRLALTLSLLLAACAQHGDRPPEPDRGRVERHAAQGYAASAPRRLEPELVLPHPLGPDHPAPTLLRAQDCGACPVVVYLPGLGETARAGRRWREAWAQAGYAVLSLQALAEDESAWRSELARSGEFRQLGQERFGSVAAARRVAQLRRVLPQLRQRSELGQLDWSHAALAGYELGAQTALDFAAATPDFNWQAVLLISPPNASAPADWRLPVLLLSGEHDGDPLAQLDTGHAAQRQALFRSLPGPTWQLWLRVMNHAQFSGSPETERVERHLVGAPSIHREIEPGQRQAPLQSSRHSQGPASDRKHSPWPSTEVMTRTALEQQALQTLSLAFLDSQLRQLPQARDWLQSGAGSWVQEVGNLRRR